MNKEELNTILEEHKRWLNSNEAEGKRADLAGAELTEYDLAGADLDGAKLRGADLEGAYLRYADLAGIRGKFIFTFQILKDFAYYADDHITIGCQHHGVEYWLDNYSKIGTGAVYSEQEIEDYGNMIKYIHKNFKGR